ncbi:transcription initiation factor TFIID subunit 3 [Trichoplusia ni]|uniref:Transcription initiation factor TFIID subunit 3 n=1 Tax=Trichoplusia ni TaxID=7111 RepID=A0A7E5W4T5_TRINI|nr:transcription initiation factor TFIID subunit 3 [Trichoplusia ni]XP_026735512.1 transcription initiation factor TFIID subunit 3 [Trichoplusia ni]
MSEAYAREILRRNVAQICQTIGWNGINSTPLDILVHVLEKYVRSLGTQANRYAEQFNRTEPNLHDLGLVFRDLHIHLPELTEYTRCVPPVPPPVTSEKFPKPKESNLNFLKPGSHEVVTRPMHVHEHLPPMYPEKERDTPVVAGTVEIRQNGIDNADNSNATCTSPEISVTDSPDKNKDIFKRPTDPVSLPNSKRPRLRLEEEERTREISSVMMTMSGFLSPAREGKLPEARPPAVMSEKQYDKHKANSHHSNVMKAPILEKSDKKSKKNKLLNGKVMKSKRKDKSHKGEGSKSKDSSKLNKYPPGHPMKNKDVHPTHHNHVTMPAPKVSTPPTRSVMPPPLPVAEPLKPVPQIKQEPVDIPPVLPKNSIITEDAIPVPRKIPISKSPLVSNSIPVHKPHPSTNSFIPEVEIKKEVIDEEEKLASQPDRSKINIFKRISNKSKEDKITPEVVHEKLQSDSMISRLQNSSHGYAHESRSHETIRMKSEEPVVNNNDNSAVDLSKVMNLRTDEVINIDDDSIDLHEASRAPPMEHRPSISINKSLQLPYPKDIASVSPKIKKEKKHKDKKDKAAKLEAKLKKQQIAFELAQAEKQSLKMSGVKPPKSSRPKNESKLPPMPPGFPFFPAMTPGRGLMPGPGLIPSPGLIPGSEFLAEFANNPALRGLQPSNLLTNPFALGPGGPGLIPGTSFLPGGLNSGIRNPLIPMGSFPHTSRSSPMKIPPMLRRRPSLEVIPVDNDDDRGIHKSSLMGREKDRHDKHKSQTIPNILQKHKSKSHKDHKSNLFKMPPVTPDITIELNPPKVDSTRHEPPPRQSPIPPRLPTPEPIVDPDPEPQPHPAKPPSPELPQERELENSEKKKDKSHKKEKKDKDKDGIKIKKKKDKKDKNKDKSEKKRDKEERQELKDKIKKEKKEKKKEKQADGLVPKLTLKLSSSNSNSPMPPSSPDIFKLNIKPVLKKEEEEEDSPSKEESVSREHSRSPELAQISALVTRPPKQKHSKHNHITDIEGHSSSPPSGSSPPRKNTPTSSSKYKRILIKPLSKKGHVEHFDDDVASISEEPAPTPAPPPAPVDKPTGPLPTPYYVDEHGNKIWVCPACGRPDNGSPMIGCDGCDGWYHWVCVGITEEPGATEDWFCKSCLAKRAAMALAGVTTAGKKRGRKPKGEKIRDCH